MNVVSAKDSQRVSVFFFTSFAQFNHSIQRALFIIMDCGLEVKKVHRRQYFCGATR